MLLIYFLLHLVCAKRLAAGRLTVIDATNVRAESRKPFLEMARKYHAQPVAVVFDFGAEFCHARNQARAAERPFGPHVTRRHAEDLRRSLRRLDEEGFRRVHVFATRYVPAFPAFDSLAKVRDAEPGGVVPTRPESVYLTGRNIGDEYRYVLDRRNTKKFPGNMLDRPQFLLNPWAVRSTETGEQMAQGGEMFGRKGDPKPSESMAGSGPGGRGTAVNDPWAATAGFAALDYLADPSAVLLNLVPDKGRAFAAKHDEHYGAIRACEDWFTEFFYGAGPEADARRGHAFPLIAQEPERVPDMFQSGPECAPATDETRRRFYGED